MTLEELSAKLAKLQETSRIAEAELAALDAREERVRELEADHDALLVSYAEGCRRRWTVSRERSA